MQAFRGWYESGLIAQIPARIEGLRFLRDLL